MNVEDDSMEFRYYLKIRRLERGWFGRGERLSPWRLRVLLGEPRLPSGNPNVRGWRSGPLGSGADIELDENLEHCEIGLFPAGNHQILGGTIEAGATLPPITRFRDDRWDDGGLSVTDGRVYFRFDRLPTRIGRHVLRLAVADG
jgi:hypothetical protein